MDVLTLSIPTQHDYSDPTVELDPARLQSWVADLPQMNALATVRLVSGALLALNEQRIDTSLRYQCLEVYRPVVLRLFETVGPLQIRQHSMSTGQRHETIAAAADLFNNFANGYKLTVMELQAAGQISGEAFNRAIDALCFVLQDCFRYYRSVPPRVFSDLHQLYHHARRAGLLDVKSPAGASQQGPGTAGLYKLGMLLSLTDTERLAEGELGLLADVLREHVDACRVVQGGSWASNGSGLFLLDVDSDACPVACATLKSPAEIATPYLLDATDMLRLLRARLDDIPERVRQRSPEAMVLQRLQPAEQGASLRREQRHRDGRWVGLVVGLEEIHAQLIRVSGGNAPDSSTSDNVPLACRVIDSSENGMKLFVEAGGAGDARVGDLLGVIEGEPGQESLRLACIRSLRVLPGSGMESGVQLIAGGVGPVYCSLPEKSDAAAVPALFLPAEEGEDIAATLVALTGLYAAGCAMTIDVGGREIHVRAGRLVSDSPVFDRFEFSAE
jgi:hypothetical protein